MKYNIQLHEGTETRVHQFEFSSPGRSPGQAGKDQFALDSEAAEADWAEIALGVYSILLAGRCYEVHLTSVASLPGQAAGGGACYAVTIGGRQYHLEVRDARTRRQHGPLGEAEGPHEVLAPMPGKIVKILVNENQEVSPGQGLLVIEAMKMQNELRAPRSGRVEKIYVQEGTGVETGFRLLRLR